MREKRQLVAAHTRGTQKWNLFIKSCVFILTCLNFSHLRGTLHLMQYTYQDVFFHCSKQFWNSSILMPFGASVVFCFTSATSAKFFPLRTFFTQRNKKKSHFGRDWVNSGVGYGGHAIFGQKLLNTQCGVGRCTCKSPIMKWANVLKESSKSSLKPNSASHNNASGTLIQRGS